MANRRPESPPKAAPVRAPAPAPIAAAPENAAPKRKASRAKKPTDAAPNAPVEISEDARRGMIAEAAYLRAERRGFANGSEVEDWMAAEAEVDALLQAEHGSKTPQ